MNEETKAIKKPKFILASQIVGIILLLPAIFFFAVTLDSYVSNLNTPETTDFGTALGVGLSKVLVVIFIFLFYAPSNILSLVFSISGFVTAKRYYGKVEAKKGKAVDYSILLAALIIGVITAAFAVFVTISYTS